ncbi:MAG: ATP-binding protein [Anaerobacillus sp.]|uniref:ATP-binding protein n=1 Tax=Anaerobacillus sp. TaxID=1872506 RepID=UPI00391C690C
MINLFLNVLIIFVCTFIYYIFLLNPMFETKYRQFIVGSLAMVAIALCIMFPYYDVNGTIYDLRTIPFLLGALYGGRKVAFALFVGLISFRFLMGLNPGLYVTVVQAFGMLFFTYIFTGQFIKGKFSRKLLITLPFMMAMWLVNYTVYLLFYADLLNTGLIIVLMSHFLFKVLTFLLVLYIIEYFLKNLRYKEGLNGAEKLRVISQLAASVSHEIRNPLTVTRGFLQLLNDDHIEYEKRKEYLELSLYELDRAQSIITDYLTLAKPNGKTKLEKLSSITEVNYVVKVMTPYALMQGVEVSNASLKEGYILGDRYKFRQSLINIVKNGIEAMPNGGQLVIDALTTSRGVVISIKDTGVGMAQEQIDQMGVPISSTKNAGTGLGTMVAYQIIKAMGGKVEVKSRRGIGTVFTLVFPHAK